jgi:hypothetical protein
MVGAKDVLLFSVQWGSAFNFIGKENENHKKLGPHAIDDTHPPEFLWIEYRYEQGDETNQEQDQENDQAIGGVNSPRKLHVRSGKLDFFKVQNEERDSKPIKKEYPYSRLKGGTVTI